MFKTLTTAIDKLVDDLQGIKSNAEQDIEMYRNQRQWYIAEGYLPYYGSSEPQLGDEYEGGIIVSISVARSIGDNQKLFVMIEKTH